MLPTFPSISILIINVTGTALLLFLLLLLLLLGVVDIAVLVVKVCDSVPISSDYSIATVAISVRAICAFAFRKIYSAKDTIIAFFVALLAEIFKNLWMSFERIGLEREKVD